MHAQSIPAKFQKQNSAISILAIDTEEINTFYSLTLQL